MTGGRVSNSDTIFLRRYGCMVVSEHLVSSRLD